MTDTRRAGLAETFVAIARELDAATTPGETRRLVTRAAVRTVPGCVHAAIALVLPHGQVTTVAATGGVADRIGAIQVELGEGPCLGAIGDHVVYVVDDFAHEHRWPRFSERTAAETGIASMLTFRLFTAGDTTGALNLYGAERFAFTGESQAIGAVLAAYAAMALVAAAEHERAEHLSRALHNSRRIGTAIGILMVRRNISSERAFDVLVGASQRLNRKLHDISAAVVETRGVPRRPDEPVVRMSAGTPPDATGTVEPG